jgi:hypothetical protein
VPGLEEDVGPPVFSYKCDVCIGLDGTERPMDGTWTIKIGKKTKKVAHAPAHPNCTCRVVAMKPSWKDKLGKLVIWIRRVTTPRIDSLQGHYV